MTQHNQNNIILCSFTNVNDNECNFETYWICPKCKNYYLINYEDNNALCVNDSKCLISSKCFNFNIKDIEGLNNYYTKFNDYSLLNNPLLKNLIIQKNIKSKKKFSSYDYYEYLLNNNIVKPINKCLFDKYKETIDKIKPPFGFDCIVVYIYNS